MTAIILSISIKPKNNIFSPHLSDSLDLFDVLGVARDVREVGELHVEGAELGQDGGAAARPPKVLGRGRAHVHQGVGDAWNQISGDKNQ